METIARNRSMLDARVRRSNSVLLASSDLHSFRYADYHRLSYSMRLPPPPPEHDHEFPPIPIRKGNNNPWNFFTKVFSAFGKRNADQEEDVDTKKRPASRKEATRKKRRPTFIPDPHRRWA